MDAHFVPHMIAPVSDEEITPDAMLPEQFFAGFLRGIRHVEGEKRLMLGVLEDAVRCFQKYARAVRGKPLIQFRNAQRWIFRTENPGWMFSFENICEVLELNPTYLRRGLMRWRRRHLRNPNLKIAYGLSRSSGTSHLIVTKREEVKRRHRG